MVFEIKKKLKITILKKCWHQH